MKSSQFIHPSANLVLLKLKSARTIDGRALFLLIPPIIPAQAAFCILANGFGNCESEGVISGCFLWSWGQVEFHLFHHFGGSFFTRVNHNFFVLEKPCNDQAMARLTARFGMVLFNASLRLPDGTFSSDIANSDGSSKRFCSPGDIPVFSFKAS